MPNGSGYAIEGVGLIILKIHDKIAKKLDEILCISSFCKNLIFLRKLDSNSYMRAGDGILKVLYGSRIDLQEKKYGDYYILIGNPVQGRVPSVDRSSV